MHQQMLLGRFGFILYMYIYIHGALLYHLILILPQDGLTPLHVAAHYDNQNVALLLLKHGASPHAPAKVLLLMYLLVLICYLLL